MPLTFATPKVVKYSTGAGTTWAESQDFGYVKVWNGSSWQYITVRPYADVNEETQTVTVGSNIFKSIENYGYGGFYGSISDGTFGFISDAVINALVWSNASNALTFELAGNRANSGWSTVIINGITFNRASATYNYDGGTDSTSWLMAGPNPFGTTDGVNIAAVFTQ